MRSPGVLISGAVPGWLRILEEEKQQEGNEVFFGDPGFLGAHMLDLVVSHCISLLGPDLFGHWHRPRARGEGGRNRS